MPLAEVNGTEIYYEVHGSGPPLILAHGVGGNHAIWWQQIPRLSQFYMVVTFDHRGFGRSKEIPEGPHRGDYVNDLLGLLDHLEIEPCRPCGSVYGRHMQSGDDGLAPREGSRPSHVRHHWYDGPSGCAAHSRLAQCTEHPKPSRPGGVQGFPAAEPRPYRVVPPAQQLQ